MRRRDDYNVNIAGGFGAAQLTLKFMWRQTEFACPPNVAYARTEPIGGRSWIC